MKQLSLLMLVVLAVCAFADETEEEPSEVHIHEEKEENARQIIEFSPFSSYFHRGMKTDTNWPSIISQLYEDHTKIPVSQRTEYITKAMQSAEKGELDYETVFELTGYLEKETEAEPWLAAIDHFKYMNAMLSNTASYGLYKKHMEKILLPIYKSLGFSERSGELSSTKKLRAAVVDCACTLRNKDCTQNAVQVFSRWMANPDNPSNIPSYLKYSVMCTAVREGGEEEWDFAFNSYKKSTDNEDRKKMIYSLSCSRQSWTLKRLLEMSLDVTSEVRDAEGSHVIMNVARNPIGQCMAFNFVRDRFNDMKRRFTRESSIKRIVESIPEFFNTDIQLQEFEEFVEIHKASLSSISLTAVEQSLHQTKKNCDWMKKNYYNVNVWLEENYSY